MADSAQPEDHNGPLLRTLQRLTSLAHRFPFMTLLLSVCLASGAIWLTRQRLKFKTQREDLISSHADYHKRWMNYRRVFGPVSQDELVVAVEDDSPEKIGVILEEVGTQLEAEPALFTHVFYKVDPSGLKAKGLQYLSPDQLQIIVEHLREFGPVLNGRWQLLTLSRVIRDLRHKLTQAEEVSTASGEELSEGLLQQISQLVSSLGQFGHSNAYESPWQELVPLDRSQREEAAQIRYVLNEQGTMGFVTALPVDQEAGFSGATRAVDRLRSVVNQVAAKHPRARLGVTGVPVLESDEMRSTQASMSKASLISLIGVALILLLGFRGVRHPLFAIATLAIAMAWSFGYTTLAVGHLNILSVSFAAMLIGLGIDFGIVYLTRYLELRHAGRELGPSLMETASSIGPGLITAAVTTSLAFLVAVFTDFTGVAELGIIAAGGIVLCAAAALILIPAFCTLFDANCRASSLPNPFSGHWLRSYIARHPVAVTMLSLYFVVGVTVWGVCRQSQWYDHNLLNMHVKGTESINVLDRIFERSESSLLYAISLADSPERVRELKQKFEALPTVQKVNEISSMLPPYPADETRLLVETVHAQLSNFPDEPVRARELDPETVGRQLEQLDGALASSRSPTAALARSTLDEFLNQLAALELPAQLKLLQDYQERMTADLHGRLKSLRQASNSEPVTVDDLPKELAARFVSPPLVAPPNRAEPEQIPGTEPPRRWLLQIFPKDQVWDHEPLARFVADLRTVDPDVTGTPLQNLEASREILRSYEQTGLYALGVVLAVLLLDFRSLSSSLLALLPPVLGAALTCGILGLLHYSFNPANMIVLPLIVGIGVDGGVHVLHDYRRSRHRFYRPSGSTFNAILLNSTTTMVGFGSMMVAQHQGLQSLGAVLTVGVGSCLFVSLVTLPAVLNWMGRARSQRRPHFEAVQRAPAFPFQPHSRRLGEAPAGPGESLLTHAVVE